MHRRLESRTGLEQRNGGPRHRAEKAGPLHRRQQMVELGAAPLPGPRFAALRAWRAWRAWGALRAWRGIGENARQFRHEQVAVLELLWGVIDRMQLEFSPRALASAAWRLNPASRWSANDLFVAPTPSNRTKSCALRKR